MPPVVDNRLSTTGGMGSYNILFFLSPSHRHSPPSLSSSFAQPLRPCAQPLLPCAPSPCAPAPLRPAPSRPPPQPQPLARTK
ncbi:hypothetical protein ACOSQ3_028612 [Xanthoceras sorbifolium]